MSTTLTGQGKESLLAGATGLTQGAHPAVAFTFAAWTCAVRAHSGNTFSPFSVFRCRPTRSCLLPSSLALPLWLALQALGAPIILDDPGVAREYVQRSWYLEDGLPDKRVMALLQSHDGYLWMGTQSGIARFDGQKFTVFNRANTPQLGSDYCTDIAEDAEGNLWFGFFDGDNLVRKSGEKFKVFSPRNSGISFDRCKLLASRFGGIWCGTGIKLCRILGDDIQTFNLPAELPTNAIPLQEDDDGRLLVGSLEGLMRFAPRKETFEKLPLSFLPKGRTGVALCADSSRGAWMLSIEPTTNWMTLRPTGHVVSLKDGLWTPTRTESDEGFILQLRSSFITPDQFGALWLPGNGLGITCYFHGEYQILTMPRRGEQEFPMSALADREGNLWIGTDFSGLQRWTPRKLTTYGVKEGLAHDNVWTILEARDSTLWIGTEAGVSHFENGHFTNYNIGDDPPANVIRSIVQDPQGTIWVGTIRLIESIRNGVLSEHRLPGPWEETKIRCLLAGHDGALWVGSARGLTRLLNGERTKFTEANGPGDHDVRALLEDAARDIWVGTMGAGLFRFHEDQFSNWNTTNGLCSQNVWAFYQDSDGALWIGTDGGLSLLKDGHIAAFTTAQGLPVNQIDSILEDNFGRLWISHDQGLYWVPKAQFHEVLAGRRRSVVAVIYDNTDGLPTLEFNGQKSNPTACKTRDGRLWFPSLKGVVVIDPARVVLDETPPLTIIEQIRANGMVLLDRTKPPTLSPSENYRLNASSYSGQLAARSGTRHPRQGATAEVRQLPPGGAKVLEFRYVSPTFLAPDKVRFRFRLLGLSGQWIDADTRREAYFTDLRPGRYKFEVIARNHHGIWQEQGASFAFAVAPRLYESSWFYAACSLGLFATVYTIIAWRARELRKIHLLQEQKALAEQRERFARDVHDELGASLNQIVSLSEQGSDGTRGSDAIVRRLEHIRSVAGATLANIGQVVWATNPKYDTLFDLIGYLREFCAGYFELTPIRISFDFPEKVPTMNVTGVIRRQLLLIVKECLQNVVKHAAASEVHIRLELFENHLKLSVRDNGRGLPMREQSHHGDGIANMRSRVAHLGGKVDLEILGEGGTIVRICVPLPIESLQQPRI
jgi:ligand-binding sensor domain-containing protein/signal transduction histidine kinase